MSEISLSEMMNSMIARLETTQADALDHIPEERHWQMIGLYIQVDPLLAQLYKQYSDAKDRLGKLLAHTDPNDPITEVAWDMHDSLRSAIETRLIELKDNSSASDKIAALKNELALTCEREDRKAREKEAANSMDQLLAFMLWVSLVMKDSKSIIFDLRNDFCQAS